MEATTGAKPQLSSGRALADAGLVGRRVLCWVGPGRWGWEVLPEFQCKAFTTYRWGKHGTV